MNRDVFLSLLALDSYNRGEGAALNGLTESGAIGTAAIREFQPGEQEGWDAAGFYAIAYEWNNETVISYRGTNFPSSFSDPAQVAAFLSDFLDGWSIFTGFGGGKQVSLAADFFKAVSNNIEFKNGEPRVLVNPPTLVGHSLGGALAGYVASRATVDAVAFNPVPFGALAQADALHEAWKQTLLDFGRALEDVDPTSIIPTLLDPLGLIPNDGSEFPDFYNILAQNYIERAPEFDSVRGHWLNGEIARQITNLQMIYGPALTPIATSLNPILGAIIGSQAFQGLANAASGDEPPRDCRRP